MLFQWMYNIKNTPAPNLNYLEKIKFLKQPLGVWF